MNSACATCSPKYERHGPSHAFILRFISVQPKLNWAVARSVTPSLLPHWKLQSASCSRSARSQCSSFLYSWRTRWCAGSGRSRLCWTGESAPCRKLPPGRANPASQTGCKRTHPPEVNGGAARQRPRPGININALLLQRFRGIGVALHVSERRFDSRSVLAGFHVAPAGQSPYSKPDDRSAQHDDSYNDGHHQQDDLQRSSPGRGRRGRRCGRRRGLGRRRY